MVNHLLLREVGLGLFMMNRVGFMMKMDIIITMRVNIKIREGVRKMMKKSRSIFLRIVMWGKDKREKMRRSKNRSREREVQIRIRVRVMSLREMLD